MSEAAQSLFLNGACQTLLSSQVWHGIVVGRCWCRSTTHTPQQFPHVPFGPCQVCVGVTQGLFGSSTHIRAWQYLWVTGSSASYGSSAMHHMDPVHHMSDPVSCIIYFLFCYIQPHAGLTEQAHMILPTICTNILSLCVLTNKLTAGHFPNRKYFRVWPSSTSFWNALHWAQIYNEPQPRLMSFNYGLDYPLEAVRAPTVLLIGGNDVLAPPNSLDLAARQLKGTNVEQHSIGDYSHMVSALPPADTVLLSICPTKRMAM